MAKERISRKKIIGATVCILLAIGSGIWLNRMEGIGSSGPTQSAGTRIGQPQPPAIPVTSDVVKLSDFPVYLDGLGTVQPYDTVVVRSRVDGEVVKVAFKQGQIVKQGDLLVQIDPRPFQAALAQAQAKKAQDQAMLRNAQLNLQRAITLAARQAGPQQQVDTQRALVDQLTAQVEGDQANIDSAQTQLSYTTIKSPLTGKVGFRQIDPGNIVHSSDPNGIVTIVKLQPISVVFTAPEEQVQRINKALEIGQVPVLALSSDGTRTLAEGHLAIVNNQVDVASGTIQMKATFQNKDNVLWPGLSVLTRLRLETLHNVVVIPNQAVQRGPNGLYVFIIGDQNRVKMQPINVGEEEDTTTHVTSGLQAGERVVVAGQYRLTPGALVNSKELTPPRLVKDGSSTTENKQTPSSTTTGSIKRDELEK
jgi:membrane fusion protein, multidrug efflux system